MKRFFLFFFLTFFLISGQAFASDRKLVHGAGTLPHLTSAFTLSAGFEMPTPIIYALRYDIGLGNRVQLGVSSSVLFLINTVEVHSMFNVLKSASDRDFVSLYLNPSFADLNNPFSMSRNKNIFLLAPGVAYEHRFGRKRNVGIYTKVNANVLIGEIIYGRFVLGGREATTIDFRIGLQALLGEHFSISLEPYLSIPETLIGGKVAISWAYNAGLIIKKIYKYSESW
jgi:hypothetical protein